MAGATQTFQEPSEVDVREAPEPVARRVRAWFGRTAPGRSLGILDGSRSVLLPYPDRSDRLLKIKGAGLLGEGIRFGNFLKSGPMAVTFDFDGRMMEDVAAGHDNAQLGGASFQQAATEYRVTALLHEWGEAVVPCLGYGRVTTPHGISWFSIFEWRKDWSGIAVSPDFPVERYMDTNVVLARHMLELATRHDLVGYFGYVRDAEGRLIIKDVHPFRRLDPVNHSQLSFTLELLQALWVRCSACRFFARAGGLALADDELAAVPLQALVAGAGASDYRMFEEHIVEPFLHRRPGADFTPETLYDALRSVRVASAALDLCPKHYARFAT